MPAALLDPSAMTPAARDELLGALAGPKILAEPETGVGAGWMVLAVVGAACAALSFAWLGLGVVDSPWAKQGAWIYAPYAIGFALTALGVTKAVLAVRRRRLPWPTGRYLTTYGFIDARQRPIRVRSIADFTKTEVRRSEGESGLALYTIDVHFGGEVEAFQVFGTERNVPREGLATLAGARDAHIANQRSERGYRSGASGDEARAGESAPAPGQTGAPAAKAPLRVADHPVKLALALALVAIVPLRCGLLPWASVRAARARGTIAALRAARAAYPDGWVVAALGPLVHRRYDDARAAVASKMAPEPAALFTRLLTWLEQHDRSTVRFRLEAPSQERIAAATTALEAAAAAFPGARPAPVVLHYQVVSLAAVVVGQSELARGVGRALADAIPPDVLELEAEPDALGDKRPDATLPLLVVTSSVTTTSVFRGEGTSLFAALTFDYDAALELPGEARAPLVARVTVEPPNDLSVSRLQLGKEKPAPLGASGDPLLDRMDDSMVYTKQVTVAADRAGSLVGARLLAR